MTSSTSRSLHLVDLENLLANPRASAPVALATFDQYLAVARWQSGDHVIVATNPWLMGRIAFELSVPASLHAVHGHDGADVMLLSLAPPEWVVKRFDRLVIGSGDGIFSGCARRVRRGGVAVEIVSRSSGCSKKLHRFSCTVFRHVVDVTLAA
jgi:hypothetical protein